eukprot:948554_1
MSAQLLVWAVQIMSWVAISCTYKNCWSLSGLESVFSSGSRVRFDGNYMYKGCHNGKAYYGASSGWYLYWSAQTTNWHITKSMNEETAKAYCPENSLLLCSSNNAWRTYDGNGWIDAPTARNVVCATQHPSYYPTIHPSIYPTMDPSNNPTNNPSRNPTVYPTNNPSHNPTVYPTNNPSLTPTNHPTAAPTFVPTELPSYSTTQHPARDPTQRLFAVVDNRESTRMTTQSVTHNRMSTTEPTMELVAHPNDDIIQWIEALVREEMALYVMIALCILFIVCNIMCCCCCWCSKRKKHKQTLDDMIEIQANATDSIQMGTIHETHQIVTCDLDFEREMVASWLRYTVQLPQYFDLFISQGYSTMRAIKHIECKEDLDALGIPRGIHQALILTEIKKLQGTDFIGTHGRDVVTKDDGPGHATKSGVLRLPRAPVTSTGCITSNDSDSDDSLYVSVKGTQKQKHRRDYLTQLTAEGE